MRNPLFAVFLFALATPATAQQQSESYKFIQAVRDAKGNDVIQMIDRPGSTIVNSRDAGSGDGALHIVVKRADATYLRFLLAKGADANLRDAKGNTPLLLAASGGQADLVPILIDARANVNLANASGETPLIRATQRRDAEMVRILLAAGADADQTDNLAGLSARQYAAQDSRNVAIAKIFADTPRKPRRAVAGPKF